MHKIYSPRIFRTFTIVFMVCLCLLFNYLTQINFLNIELPKNNPEYNAKNAVGKVYNNNGELIYTLTSESAWQFPENNRLFMSQLHGIVYNESSGIIKYDLVSQDGWINYERKLGFLGKDAVLIVNYTNPSQIVKIYGDDINLDLNKNLFVSTENIKAIQNNSTITGRGFEYDRERQFLTIKSNVKIVYNQ